MLKKWLNEFNADDVHRLAKELLNGWLFDSASALSDKGLLVFASALCDRTIVAVANAYLKEHYGMRIGECRALLDMASGADSADGWSKDEFEDRMIADGGFAIAEGILKSPYDKRPTLELDYGARKLFVVLDDELNCIIVSAEGKVLKNLPTAGQGRR